MSFFNKPILVVDDYPVMLKIMVGMVKALGYTDVDSALNGQEALQKMREKSYGVIISDWNMEPVNGYDLLTYVRNKPIFTNTRFIMVTGESRSETILAAKQAGVDDYIVKPFDHATLQQKMDRLLHLEIMEE